MEMHQLIRKKRLAAGVSQGQTANALGLTQPYLSQLELGKRAPSVDVLLALAIFLNTTPNDLLGVSSLVSPRDGPDFLSRCFSAWRECSEAVAAMDPRELAAGLSDENRERIRAEASEARQALDELLEAI